MLRVLLRQATCFQKRYSSTLPAVRKFKENASEATAIYANPLCMQMDQMILRAANPEDVLMLLVTHRGVIFVHNLVTAVSSLADMSQRSVPFSKLKKFKYPTEFEKSQRDKMLEDPRYVLLVRDLMEYSAKLDLASIELILSALQKMDHCHYRLLGSLLKRIYSIDLAAITEAGDITRAISVGSSLQWAGFGKASLFYDNLSHLLLSNVDSLKSVDFLNALMTYSKLDKFYPKFYASFASELVGRSSVMPAHHLGIAAIAISEYGGEVQIQLAVRTLATAMLDRDEKSLRDLVRVCVSLRRTNVFHAEFFRLALARAMSELVESHKWRVSLDPSVASISDLAQLLDSSAHFGIAPEQDAFPSITGFLEDNVDVITEESSIRFLSFFSVFPNSIAIVSAPLVNLLIRKVGSGTSWERHKTKLVYVLFSKCMQFEFLDAEFKKFVTDKIIAHWVLSRRGYGVPFPEEGRSLFDSILGQAANTDCLFNQWIPNSPYNADILCPSRRIVVLVLSKFDTANNPVGPDLVQTQHVGALGWQVIPINRKWINDLPTIARLSELLA